ncbi:MAG: tRNA modification GTPase [Myxococcales bacterium]|nr:tRNA modification GTPase [Myxococcales bacterium]
MTPQTRSTLVGVATGTPDGGVAIVRLSGPAARTIAAELTGSLPSPRRLARRRLHIGAPGEARGTEDALVVVMPGPRSFTGEDVVELHIHAGARNVQQVVDALLACGATAAGPGEFSRRAFELGRLDLEQAEGIAALVAAQTDAALAQARRLVAGELGRRVDAVREQVAGLRGEIEANLDFPEDVTAADTTRWSEELEGLRGTVAGWLRRFEAGRRAREVARIALAGPPNAGKSSLFNALVQRERAIVSPQPGTTRDYVEAALELDPHGAVLIDTAGLRGVPGDELELAGIARTRDQLAGADIVLWIEAADEQPVERGVDEGVNAHVVLVESKRDLGCARPDWLGVSTRTGAGLDRLRATLRRWFVDGDASADDSPWIGLARHRERASEALASIEACATRLGEDAPLELVAFELGAAERRLAEITGRHALGAIGEDVLRRIFSRFCIGK